MAGSSVHAKGAGDGSRVSSAGTNATRSSKGSWRSLGDRRHPASASPGGSSHSAPAGGGGDGCGGNLAGSGGAGGTAGCGAAQGADRASGGNGAGGDDVVVLDVRNGYEWDAGHFQGAERPNEVRSAAEKLDPPRSPTREGKLIDQIESSVLHGQPSARVPTSWLCVPAVIQSACSGRVPELWVLRAQVSSAFSASTVLPGEISARRDLPSRRMPAGTQATFSETPTEAGADAAPLPGALVGRDPAAPVMMYCTGAPPACLPICLPFLSRLQKPHPCSPNRQSPS